jgi:hypothetical protein
MLTYADVSRGSSQAASDQELRKPLLFMAPNFLRRIRRLRRERERSLHRKPSQRKTLRKRLHAETRTRRAQQRPLPMQQDYWGFLTPGARRRKRRSVSRCRKEKEVRCCGGASG